MFAIFPSVIIQVVFLHCTCILVAIAPNTTKPQVAVAAVHLFVAVTSDTYLVLRSDNPSQLFIPLESFRYVTWLPLAHGSSHVDLVSRAFPETQSYCQPWPQRVTIGLFLFNCVASVNKETTGCFCSLSLWHQGTIYNLQIHSFLKARLRHIGPTWDCYLWHTTWPIWPCCSVSTWWAFSGTGEVGWCWSHNFGALTASVGNPWKCRCVICISILKEFIFSSCWKLFL